MSDMVERVAKAIDELVCEYQPTTNAEDVARALGRIPPQS